MYNVCIRTVYTWNVRFRIMYVCRMYVTSYFVQARIKYDVVHVIIQARIDGCANNAIHR